MKASRKLKGGGLGFRRKEGRDGGINRKKYAGWRHLRTLLWTLYPLNCENKGALFFTFVVLCLAVLLTNELSKCGSCLKPLDH